MRGDGFLFRRPGSPYWHARISVAGHPVSFSTKETDEKKALRALRRRSAEYATGAKVVEDRRFTVGDALDLVVDDYARRGLRSAHLLPQIRRRLAYEFGPGDAVADLNQSRVDRYVTMQRNAGLALSTVRQDIVLLSRGLTLAVERGLLRSKPTLRAPVVGDSNARQGFVSEDEMRSIAAILGEPWGDFVRFLFYSAWRSGEARGLRWSDYHPAHREIRLPRERDKAKAGRVLPLGGPLVEIIDRRLAARGGEFIFHDEGEPIGDIRKRWHRACRLAGLDRRILLHDLRRSGIRQLRALGVDQAVAMRISGHKTDSIFRRYAIVTTDDVREALERNRPSSVLAGALEAGKT